MAFVTSWSDERIASLVQLNAEGLSSSEIAARLGDGITRCAVIGKLQRLGIASAYSPKAGPKTPKEDKPRIIRAKKRTEPVEHRVVSRFRVNGSGLVIIDTTESDVAPLRCVDVTPLNIPLLDLEDGQCRFPYGGDDGIPYTFCGHPSKDGSSLCVPHHHLCWKKPEPPKGTARKYFGTDFARGYAA